MNHNTKNCGIIIHQMSRLRTLVISKAIANIFSVNEKKEILLCQMHNKQTKFV